MKPEEMSALIEQYFTKDGYAFPRHFEHRFDELSSAMMYSLIRDRTPVKCLEIGTWLGGSTCIIMSALQKNEQDFTFVASELEDDNRTRTESHVFEQCGRAPLMIGDITQNLDSIPEELDFLFVDTNHDVPVTEWIVEHIWPRVKKGGLFVMHDWAVEEVDGVLIGKGADGKGGFPETTYLMDLHREGKFPFKKLFWTYKVTGEQETAFWEKI